ncbi:MAG TPA: Hsp20/alpha crystallin family protein [Thermoplasmata archaeon]|nr:Hsp20/alpha crystallin family protein [Thermoplasmata archaeon]
MVSDPPGEGEGSPADVDRLLRRLDAHRSLPAVSATRVPVLGPPSPVADERHVEPGTFDVVETPDRIYVTLELPGASKETLEVATTNTRLTVHALTAGGRVFHREIELEHPVEPEAITATYRNGVLDVTLPRRRGHKVRVRRGA